MTRYSVSFGSWPGASCPSGEFFTSVARQAEELGFHGIYVGDHLQLGAPIPEAVTTLALMGAATSRIRLGPMVLLLPMRPPVLTAQQLATLDHLTDGRLTVGVGVGGEHPAEWRAAGVPRSNRGARTDAYLEVLPALMRGERVSHSGPFVELEDVALNPGVVQPGGPPIWIGGRSDAALARAGRHQGWCAYAESPRGFARKKDAIVVRGSRPDDFAYTVMLSTWVAERREAAANALRAALRER
jgi:alkanesulfonate monooxygenase SsuD/methylene tetrahydromethanopterin reductase-like flavin-dependent oxidoreductase (luciferase family)